MGLDNRIAVAGMVSKVNTGRYHAPPNWTDPPAGADGTEADAAHNPDTQLSAVEADTDMLDADAVERNRQSRLSRWQAQRL